MLLNGMIKIHHEMVMNAQIKCHNKISFLQYEMHENGYFKEWTKYYKLVY